MLVDGAERRPGRREHFSCLGRSGTPLVLAPWGGVLLITFSHSIGILLSAYLPSSFALEHPHAHPPTHTFPAGRAAQDEAASDAAHASTRGGSSGGGGGGGGRVAFPEKLEAYGEAVVPPLVTASEAATVAQEPQRPLLQLAARRHPRWPSRGNAGAAMPAVVVVGGCRCWK